MGRPQSKATPIRLSLRQTTWQRRCKPSVGRTSVNWVGIPSGLATSSAAPVSDKLRTAQSIALPPNSIVPAFKTRCYPVLSHGIDIGPKSQKLVNRLESLTRVNTNLYRNRTRKGTTALPTMMPWEGKHSVSHYTLPAWQAPAALTLAGKPHDLGNEQPPRMAKPGDQLPFPLLVISCIVSSCIC